MDISEITQSIDTLSLQELEQAEAWLKTMEKSPQVENILLRAQIER